MSEFNRNGGFMKFITDLCKRKFGIAQKDTWNPADIWIINGNQNSIESQIKNAVEGKHQTIRELNTLLRGMFHEGRVMGISLKKTGPVAYYEKVNLDGIITDTKNYNYNVPMTDLQALFTIDSSTGMFSQDVKITVDAQQENKTFTFQIKANDSGATNGSNLKFEPTAKGAGLARLGKAPVEEVSEILRDIKRSAAFVNKYQDYPGTETAFKTHAKKGETYFTDTVLPTLTSGNKKITTGLSGDTTYSFNGMGCLAASLVEELKDGPGNVYIEDPERPHGWIDYDYYVWGNDGKSIWISIFDGSECIFVGKPQALLDKYD